MFIDWTRLSQRCGKSLLHRVESAATVVIHHGPPWLPCPPHIGQTVEWLFPETDRQLRCLKEHFTRSQKHWPMTLLVYKTFLIPESAQPDYLLHICIGCLLSIDGFWKQRNSGLFPDVTQNILLIQRNHLKISFDQVQAHQESRKNIFHHHIRMPQWQS